MAELPEGMLQRGRVEDNVFEASEYLYRRIPHDLWEADYINLDAIELPDMSVNRQKYGTQRLRSEMRFHSCCSIVGAPRNMAVYRSASGPWQERAGGVHRRK